MRKIDWDKHMRDYEASGLTMKEFCREKGLSFCSFRNQRYNKQAANRKGAVARDKTSFQEFDVGLNLKISLDTNQTVSMHGLSPDHIPAILRAIDALS